MLSASISCKLLMTFEAIMWGKGVNERAIKALFAPSYCFLIYKKMLWIDSSLLCVCVCWEREWGSRVGVKGVEIMNRQNIPQVVAVSTKILYWEMLIEFFITLTHSSYSLLFCCCCWCNIIFYLTNELHFYFYFYCGSAAFMIKLDDDKIYNFLFTSSA